MNRKLLTDYLKKNEIKIFRGNERSPVKYGNWIANSFAFESNSDFFLLETGCTKNRLKEILPFTKKLPYFSIINTHWHFDHTANNGKIAKKNTEIFFHFNAKNKLEHPIDFYTRSTKLMFDFMNTQEILNRYGFGTMTNKTIHLLKKINPSMAYYLSVLDFKSYYGNASNKLSNNIYLEKSKQDFLPLKNISLSGWQINKNLFAFETPGHTDDSISYLLKDRKMLFVGDLDFFPNPNSAIEGDIANLHKTINNIIKIVKKEKIEFLGRSHYIPIIGNNTIINHLLNYQKKQLILHKQIKRTIRLKEIWTWKELVINVYLQKNPTVNAALKLNYKNAPGFIDNYLYLTLIEEGYLFDFQKKIWERNK